MRSCKDPRDPPVLETAAAEEEALSEYLPRERFLRFIFALSVVSSPDPDSSLKTSSSFFNRYC